MPIQSNIGESIAITIYADTNFYQAIFMNLALMEIHRWMDRQIDYDYENSINLGSMIA